MRNRAKCKLCASVIESFHSSDLVVCKCGEIEVDGGDSLRCAAKDWNNFLRVDDDGNEIVVSVKDDVKQIYIDKPLGRDDLIKELNTMRENIERMPSVAMTSPITHYDFCALLILMHAILRSKE